MSYRVTDAIDNVIDAVGDFYPIERDNFDLRDRLEIILDNLFADGKRDGFDSGYDEAAVEYHDDGYDRGYDEGFEAGKEEAAE